MGQPKPTLAKAIALLEEIRALRKRWGRSAGAGQHNVHDLLDALDVLYEESNIDGPTKAELTKANRQLAAAGARAAQAQQRIEELETSLRLAQEDGRAFQQSCDVYSSRVSTVRTILDQPFEHAETQELARGILAILDQPPEDMEQTAQE